jgi:hypothetical protein
VADQSGLFVEQCVWDTARSEHSVIVQLKQYKREGYFKRILQEFIQKHGMDHETFIYVTNMFQELNRIWKRKHHEIMPGRVSFPNYPFILCKLIEKKNGVLYTDFKQIKSKTSLQNMENTWTRLESYLPQETHKESVKIYKLSGSYKNEKERDHASHVRKIRRMWHENIQNICDNNRYSQKSRIKTIKSKY